MLRVVSCRFAAELFVKKPEYGFFEALNPFFEVVLRGLSGLVDGKHYFDTIADSVIFESRYHFPGWPVTIRGRANLMASLSGYGNPEISEFFPCDVLGVCSLWARLVPLALAANQ